MEDKIEVFQSGFGEINISKQKNTLFIHQYFRTIEITKLLGYRDKLKNENFSKLENLFGNVKISPFPLHI